MAELKKDPKLKDALKDVQAYLKSLEVQESKPPEPPAEE